MQNPNLIQSHSSRIIKESTLPQFLPGFQLLKVYGQEGGSQIEGSLTPGLGWKTKVKEEIGLYRIFKGNTCQYYVTNKQLIWKVTLTLKST